MEHAFGFAIKHHKLSFDDANSHLHNLFDSRCDANFHVNRIEESFDVTRAHDSAEKSAHRHTSAQITSAIDRVTSSTSRSGIYYRYRLGSVELLDEHKRKS